jgi:tetratricopeptide (TPR) repeat protein
MDNSSALYDADNLDEKLQEAAQQVAAGQFQEGEALAKKVLESDKKNAQAHYVLGLGHYMRKQYRIAAQAFKVAAVNAPQNPMIFSNLGESLRRSKQTEEALKAFNKSLHLLPNFNLALMGMANCFSDLKQNEKAIKAFQRLIAANPDFAPAYHYLGAHLSRNDQYKQALPMLRKAVALRENYFDAQMTLAGTLESLDKVDEAIQVFESILEHQPKNIPALMNLGNIQKTLGKLDEANEMFDRVLEIDPENLGVQYSLSHSVNGKEASNIENLEKRFDDPRLPKEAKRALHFTIGKYYDDKGEPEKAFEHFKQGNEMDDRIPPYKPEQFRGGVDRLMEVYTEDFYKQRKGMGCESEVPVIIVGMPRSGTSLTEQILSSHTRVFGAGELKNLGDIMRSIQSRFKSKAPYPNSVRMLDPITACNLGERYVAEVQDLADRGDFDRITDKMPGNHTNLGLLASILPKARVVHCMRNPMDSCFSNFSHNFASVISFSRDLEWLGHHYKDYRRIMEHWKKVLPLEIMELRYEDMIADNEGMSKKLIDFVGLDWDPACLEFQKTERRVKTASTVQIRQPIYSSSVARWRRYEEQLKPLYDTLGEWAPDENDNYK